MDYQIPTCPYCGKERPFHPYGGVGPCDCETSKRERERSYQEIKERESRKEAEEHEKLHRLANSCSHEWVGGSLPFTTCRKCGISLGMYHKHK